MLHSIRKHQSFEVNDAPLGIDVDEAWRIVLDLARIEGQSALRQAENVVEGTRLRATPEATQLLDLFLPLCPGRRGGPLVVAHIAQSIDGRIATKTGESQFISGEADLIHTHRLRAISDAVVVGIRTCLTDDPLLTTRRVSGRSPTRVVIDPRGLLPDTARVLNDDSAPTWIVTTNPKAYPFRDHVRILPYEQADGHIDLPRLVSDLGDLGLRRIFVEGGGITVSRFLEASLLDRLHVAVAPTILGSGRPSFELSPITRLAERHRLKFRQFSLEGDILLDCEILETADLLDDELLDGAGVEPG